MYQEALALELARRQIPFAREVPLPVMYKGIKLTCSFRADFVCYGEVLVELKAIPKLTAVEEAQVLNYLRATGLKRALLINYSPTSVERIRFVN